MKAMQIIGVFDAYQFFQNEGGRYQYDEGFYPALGLPGSINIKDGSILHLRLQPEMEKQVQRLCLNGVIDRLRFHVSRRTNAPDTMLVFASDLINEFLAFEVPALKDVDQLMQILEG